MIYTSYFGNRTLTKNSANWSFFSIARGAPAWFYHPYIHLNALYNMVAPSAHLLRGYKDGTINEADYLLIYKEALNKLSVDDLLRFVYSRTSPNTEPVFLCWEKPPEFCHRYPFGGYISVNGGVEVVEF